MVSAFAYPHRPAATFPKSDNAYFESAYKLFIVVFALAGCFARGGREGAHWVYFTLNALREWSKA